MRQRASVGFALAIALMSGCTPESRYDGPVIDAHAHLRLGEGDGMAPTHTIGTSALRALDDTAGVSRTALIVMMRSGDMNYVRAKNDSLLAAVAADSAHFYPVASVHPFDGDSALTELERLARRGVRQIKLHPNSQEFDVADPRVARVTARAGSLGMAVLFDAYNPLDPGQFGKLLALSMQQPGTKFVLAHMTFTHFRETLVFALLRKRGAPRNVWLDLSAIVTAYANSPVQPELVWTMRQVGTDRLIFGSDWPVDAPAAALEAVRGMGLTRAEQQQVLHDNVAALLGLP